jgi:large subunit ribosomal protein L3e
MRALSTVWAANLEEAVKRRMYKNWMNAKKKAFTKYAEKHKHADEHKDSIARTLNRLKKYCTTVRVLCATQIGKLHFR